MFGTLNFRERLSAAVATNVRNQHGGVKEYAPPSVANASTEIHVLSIQKNCFVESADLLKHPPAYRHAACKAPVDR
jgi:hypothetical protein